MKRKQPFTATSFVRSYVVPALLMFAIPAAGYAFGRYANHDVDRRFYANLTKAVQGDSELSAERAAKVLAFFRDNPPSRLCAAGARGRAMLPPSYFDKVCGTQNQFTWIARASFGSGALGVFSVLVALGCVGLSFVSREAQYRCFVAGWQVLRVTSALQVLSQGFVAVMLSFWVTAFFFERYIVKLILVVGVLALVAVARVILAIFKKPSDELTVEGEVLPREASPGLWARVEALCARLGTAPPAHVVCGIDDNFFVTEHEVTLKGGKLSGRTLFVSLSLLKRLSKPEADAVLAHEMAHFSGGDTAYSRRLGPLLTRFGAYLSALHEGLSRPIFYFMLLYRSLFQLSLGKTQRERELRADKTAAEQTSPSAVGSALLKVAAYSSYRARVENGLFERNRAHSELNIAQSVAVGFTEYAHGPRLAEDLEAEGAFPHPFDSHPSLPERLASVGVAIPKDEVPDAVVNTAVETWWSEIGGAEQLEAALWKAYEERFRAVHEISLAYRFLPATPEERAHVERFFPKVSVPGKKDGPGLEVDCEQLRYGEWSDAVAFRDVKSIRAEDHAFRGKVLTLDVRREGEKAHKRKLPVYKLAEKSDAVIQLVGRYYGRVRTAQAAQVTAGQ